MKRNSSLISLGLVFLLWFTLAFKCGRDKGGVNIRTPSRGTETGGNSPADKLTGADVMRIVDEANRKLQSVLSSEDNVRVKVDISGTVTLKGTVTTAEKKRLAENAVSGVKGVSRIDNQLTVTG